MLFDYSLDGCSLIAIKSINLDIDSVYEGELLFEFLLCLFYSFY